MANAQRIIFDVILAKGWKETERDVEFFMNSTMTAEEASKAAGLTSATAAAILEGFPF